MAEITVKELNRRTEKGERFYLNCRAIVPVRKARTRKGQVEVLTDVYGWSPSYGVRGFGEIEVMTIVPTKGGK
ncbi:hypothetical protein EBX93_17155 [bacterium]|nr:hypothetical protein [bacterium]